jgi:MFS family permease
MAWTSVFCSGAHPASAPTDAGKFVMPRHLIRRFATMILSSWATGGLILPDDIAGAGPAPLTIKILIYAAFTGLSAAQTWWDFALFRFLCGIGIGGEYAAGVALVAEVVPSRARPYCLGLLQGLGALGHLGASTISLFIGPQAMIGGMAGWRILFLIGILPAFLVVLIRLRLRESEKWVKARERVQAQSAAGKQDELHRQMGDIGEIFRSKVLRHHLIVGMLLGMAGQTGLWGIGYWTPELIRTAMLDQRKADYLQRSNTSSPAEVRSFNLDQLAQASAPNREEGRQVAVQWKAESDKLVGRGTLLQDMAGMFGIYAFTFFTARVGRRKAFTLSYLLAFGATVLTFGLLHSPAHVYWMLPLLGFCVASIYGGFAIYFPELFPTRLRSTGVGFCYNVARYITALGPLTLGKLALLYGGLGYATPLRPAAITLSAIFLVGVITVWFAPETKDKPLPD